MRPALALLLTLALAGCQAIFGPGSSGGRVSGGGGSDDGGGTTSTGGVTVSCARAGEAGPVLADETIELDCSANTSGLTWTATATPAVAFFSNQLASNGKLYVTLRAQDLPTDFAGAAVRIDVKGTSSGGEGSATVSLDALGNVLVADTNGGIAAVRSDGQHRTDFIGPAHVSKPKLVFRTRDGRFVVGEVATADNDALLLFDAHGTFVKAFDSTDHAGNRLFEADSQPWGAAEDDDGNLWISKWVGDYKAGALYRFTSDGGYDETLPPPADLATLQADWVPKGIARLADGTMAVAESAGILIDPVVAVFPPDGAASRDVKLSFEVCDTGAAGDATCHDNGQIAGRAMGLYAQGGELFVTLDEEDGANVAVYSDPDLGFLRSSRELSGSGDEHGFYNQTFGPLTSVGPMLVVAQLRYGCPVVLDPETLEVPASWRDQPSGCFMPETDLPQLEGITRLGP